MRNYAEELKSRIEFIQCVLMQSGAEGICTACFGGKYPTAIPVNAYKNRFERKLKFRKEDKENER